MTEPEETAVDRRKYAEWLQAANACATCGRCAGINATEHLANQNLHSHVLTANAEAIVPQAGYLGANYERQRILVLAKNPGGGLAPDDVIYQAQRRAVDEQTLTVNTPIIMGRANKWVPLRNLALQRTIGVSPDEIAYSNQILCRTLSPDIRHFEAGSPATFQAIYETCFEQQVSPLVKLLNPRFILVLGKKKTGSWPSLFRKLVAKSLPNFKGVIVDVTYPFGSHIRSAHQETQGLVEGPGLRS